MPIFLVCVVVLSLGCTAMQEPIHADGATDLPGAADLLVPGDGRMGSDGTGGGDGGGCIGLDECSCWGRRADCQPIAENCWCPLPKCAPGACICGGGKFLGCAPLASGCAAASRR